MTINKNLYSKSLILRLKYLPAGRQIENKLFPNICIISIYFQG